MGDKREMLKQGKRVMASERGASRRARSWLGHIDLMVRSAATRARPAAVTSHARARARDVTPAPRPPLSDHHRQAYTLPSLPSH